MSAHHLELEQFSRLEANFSELEIEPRPISVHVQATNRFGSSADHEIKDLKFNYNVSPDNLRPSIDGSLQSVLSALQYNTHLATLSNFADTTKIQCFDQTNRRSSFLTLDESGLDMVLKTVQKEDRSEDVLTADAAAPSAGTPPTASVSANTAVLGTDADRLNLETADIRVPTFAAVCSASTPSAAVICDDSTGPGRDHRAADHDPGDRLLVLFVPLEPKQGSSFGSQVTLTRSCVQKLFETVGANPEYLLNLLGRPDYWSPRTRWQRNNEDEVTTVGITYLASVSCPWSKL